MMTWQLLLNDVFFRQKNDEFQKPTSCTICAMPQQNIPETEFIFTHPTQVHTLSTNIGSFTNLMFIQPKFPNTGEPQVQTHHWFTSLEPPVHKQVLKQK